MERLNELYAGREAVRIESVSMATLGIPTTCCGLQLFPLSAGRLYLLKALESAFVTDKAVLDDLSLQAEVLQALYVLTAKPIDMQWVMLWTEQRRIAEQFQKAGNSAGLAVAVDLQGKYQAAFQCRLVEFGDQIGLMDPEKAKEILVLYVNSSMQAYQLLAAGNDPDDVKKKPTGKTSGATGRCSIRSFQRILKSIFGRQPQGT